MPDHYEILGVKKTASSGEINRVYRELSLQHHIDKVKQKQGCEELSCRLDSPCSENCRKAFEDSEKAIRDLTEAKRVLTDPRKRELYDRFGKAEIPSTITADSVVEIRMLNYNLDLWKDFIIAMVGKYMSRQVIRDDKVEWEDYDLGEFTVWEEKVRGMNDRTEINDYLHQFCYWGKQQNYPSFFRWEQEQATLNQFCKEVVFNDFVAGTYWPTISLVSFLLVVIQAGEFFLFRSRQAKITPPPLNLTLMTRQLPTN